MLQQGAVVMKHTRSCANAKIYIAYIILAPCERYIPFQTSSNCPVFIRLLMDNCQMKTALHTMLKAGAAGDLTHS